MSVCGLGVLCFFFFWVLEETVFVILVVIGLLGYSMQLVFFCGSEALPISLPDGEEKDRSSENILLFSLEQFLE